MAAFDFPNSPSNGQTYSANGVTFTWNGSVWTRTSASTGAQGAQGHQGAVGAQGAQGTAGSSTTINNNANNQVITATGTANTLQGEGNLKFDGTNLGVGVDPSGVSSYSTIHLKGQTSGNGGAIRLTDHGDTPDSDDFTIYKNSTAGYLRINGTDPLIAYLNGGEALRIDSSRRLLIGTTTEGNIAADNLTVSGSGDEGITVRSGTSNSGNLFFSDGTSGGDEYRGYLQYQHSNNKLSIGTNALTRLALDGDGRVLIGTNSDTRTTSLIISGNSSTGATGQAILNMDIGTTSISDGTSIGVFRFGATGDRRGADIKAEGAGTWSAGSSHPTDLVFSTNASGSSSTPTERMRLRSDGHLQLQHGLTGLSGGGVIVCAAKSSSGTANQSNYKVDFVVPMGDLGLRQEYEDIQAQFSSGQTGKDWAHNRGGSGILIATVQNDYYWGFRTKIYHITTYGNSTNNVTQLNLLHNYSAAGHGANSASVDLTVQSHDGKTPTLRGTFSGDYWNSNILTVTYIGSAVASTGNIRQLTAFDSKLTGQDPTWK